MGNDYTTDGHLGSVMLLLITFIEFRDNRMYVKHIVTHTEYD